MLDALRDARGGIAVPSRAGQVPQIDYPTTHPARKPTIFFAAFGEAFVQDLPYLKLFTEVRVNRKLEALYRENPAYVWIWLKLFCYSGEQPARGMIERPLFLIAAEITEGDENLLAKACNAMGALQLVTCNISDAQNAVISIHNFDKWQEPKKKPSDTAEKVAARVRKHREAKKNGKSSRDATKGDVTVKRVTVTPLKRPVTPMKRQEEEEEEEENTPPSPRDGGTASDPTSEPEDSLPPDPPARIKNDPAVIDRTAATADRLFPTLDYGIKVRQLQADYQIEVLESALFDAHAAGKRDWRYIVGIYRKRLEDGRGAGQPSPAGRPLEKSAPAHPVHREPPDSKFAKRSAAAFRAEREKTQEDQACSMD